MHILAQCVLLACVMPIVCVFALCPEKRQQQTAINRAHTQLLRFKQFVLHRGV